MKNYSLIFEKEDFKVILEYRNSNRLIEDYSHLDTLEQLEEDMGKATVLPLEDMPEDIVRLYSWVTVSSASGWRKTFQVMPPDEQDIKQDKISVQSDLGATVIGHAETDIIQFGTPIGVIWLKIEHVKQDTSNTREYLSQGNREKHLSKQHSTSF